jgi:hypothetical protein
MKREMGKRLKAAGFKVGTKCVKWSSTAGGKKRRCTKRVKKR